MEGGFRVMVGVKRLFVNFIVINFNFTVFWVFLFFAVGELLGSGWRKKSGNTGRLFFLVFRFLRFFC